MLVELVRDDYSGAPRDDLRRRLKGQPELRTGRLQHTLAVHNLRLRS